MTAKLTKLRSVSRFDEDTISASVLNQIKVREVKAEIEDDEEPSFKLHRVEINRHNVDFFSEYPETISEIKEISVKTDKFDFSLVPECVERITLKTEEKGSN